MGYGIAAGMARARRSLAAGLLAAALVLLPCPQGPAFAFFPGGVSLKDEKKMGARFNSMLRSRLPMVDDPEAKQYVADILKRITRAIPPQPFDFQSAIILHNALNAFAVPGGYVYVFTGLLMNMDNEAELAGVLSHELAHVTQRHVAARMERAQYLTLGSLLVAVAGIALGGPAGAAAAVTATGASQSAMLSYSRMDESESDNIGLQYLMAAGYPPRGMADGFKILRQKSWMSGMSIPTYLSTHPDIGDRVNSMEARIAAMPAAKRDAAYDNSRFRRVQTLLWGRYGDEKIALQRFRGKDGLALMGRGMVLGRQNQVKAAATAFSQAVAAAPDDPLVLREAGIFHYRKGNADKAAQLLAKAMRLDPRDYMASFFYARLRDDAGDHAGAQAKYREVLRHVPEDAEVHEALARSYGNSGDSFQAHAHLAYSAIYANSRKQAERHVKQAQKLAERERDKKNMRRLEKIYKERKELWDKS